MPTFNYKAKSMEGHIKSGIMDAQNIKDLSKTLKENGLFLFNAEEIDNSEKKRKSIFNFEIHKKVPISEKMLMTRNLWIMVATGLPLVKGFSILSNQSKSKRLKNALQDISIEIGKGIGLSASFEKYPDIFSELYRGMIDVGEESGTLEDSLAILSLQLEKEKEIQGKVKNALMYPLILIIVMFLVVVCLSIFVLPKLNAFFQGLNANLPLTTRMILGFGDFFLAYWHIVTLSIISLVFLVSGSIKTKTGKLFLDTLAFKIPIISSLIKKTNSASLIRSLSSLLSSGVPLIRSLQITSNTVNNIYFKRALEHTVKEVEKGSQLHLALAPHKDIFPFGVLEMIEIGEETGRTSMILKKLAEFYEQEVSDMAQRMSVIIEPIMIVIIGLGVGIFAVSIIGPLYSVLGNI